MKRLVKRLIIGTPWEASIRRVHHALTRNKNSLYDAQSIEIMRRVLRPDSNAVDVGAFEGGMLSHMVRFAPRGQHVAFEPLPEKSRAIAAAFPGVQVHSLAVGDAPGEADYVRVVRAPALSGLRVRPDLESDATTEIVRVRVDTLDRVLPANRAFALIKVDVEGGELGVFRGAVEILRRDRPVILFECGLAAEAYGATPLVVHETLDDVGLHISTLRNWLAGGKPLTKAGFRESVEGGTEYFFIAHPS